MPPQQAPIVDPYAQKPQPQAPLVDPYSNPAQQPSIDQKQAQRATDALVYSNMTGAEPSFTYENRDAIHKEFSQRLGEYAQAGWQGFTKDSITAQWLSGHLSGPFESHDEVTKFFEGFGQLAADLPLYIAG